MTAPINLQFADQLTLSDSSSVYLGFPSVGFQGINTRLVLQARLANNFQNSPYQGTVDFNDSIQDGLDEVCAFSGCIWNSATLPFTQYTTYYDLLTLLPDYIGVVAIFNATIRRWLYPSSLKKFNQDRIDWDNAYGTPYYFCPVNHRYVAIYKKPSSAGYGNMYVFYRASAPVLTDVSPVPIPDEHIMALENYCETDMWEQAQEFTKAAARFEDYKASLEKLRIQMRNKRNYDRYMSLR